MLWQQDGTPWDWEGKDFVPHRPFLRLFLFCVTKHRGERWELGHGNGNAMARVGSDLQAEASVKNRQNHAKKHISLKNGTTGAACTILHPPKRRCLHFHVPKEEHAVTDSYSPNPVNDTATRPGPHLTICLNMERPSLDWKSSPEQTGQTHPTKPRPAGSRGGQKS